MKNQVTLILEIALIVEKHKINVKYVSQNIHIFKRFNPVVDGYIVQSWGE